MELSKGDKVTVYVNISETKEPESLEIFSVVRRAAAGDDGYGEYGIEWLDIAPAKAQKIKDFLVKHPASPVALK
jgi:hypothetical protein